ncbi:hypothetical protein Premu_2582 [Hallella multisaccharivorax DSM 17128]|uniref:DUF5683 domain-containing protein n=1 Tax=Hallella multisaccharivorax DSM 17128 TaxID=688246 RepID=F8NB28_9BACT|nr:DUF5683 domain-containing protein [Hallella multisaccharivorax]EGN57936.1 hypothetical protein Premu_2582 [Hallella multisaccharivorax DSM 17128]
MLPHYSIYNKFWTAILCLLCCPLGTNAQVAEARHGNDTIHTEEFVAEDSITVAEKQAVADTTKLKKQKRDWATWKPDPKRAMWLALVMPGAGQIYNRKYWKLPIFYGGFVGCAYALRWNNMMYRDYSQAYLDIMDDNPATQSYNQFLHLGTQITSQNQAQWQDVFRKRKDRYRRWRDMSFFVMVGVYALSVIDAYVDASLSEFDITPDLSFYFSPTVINSQGNGLTPFSRPTIGLQCGFTF